MVRFYAFGVDNKPGALQREYFLAAGDPNVIFNGGEINATLSPQTVYVMNADGSGQERLTNDRGVGSDAGLVARGRQDRLRELPGRQLGDLRHGRQRQQSTRLTTKFDN